MKRFILILICLMAACLMAVPLVRAAREYPHPDTYVPSLQEVEKHKKNRDDPRPYLTTWGLKQTLPKEMYAKITFDIERMKKEWADLVGFKAPDIVGKIAPEIKPGKYTYKDVQNNPGFKQLMSPDLYKRIKPGAPPHAGNIPEFEIIPTRQYYWAQPIIDITKKNLGKTKLDAKGYPVPGTWEAGYPFPRPSGPLKAAQIMVNVEKRYQNYGGDIAVIGRMSGYDKNLKLDFNASYEVRQIRLSGRAFLEPHGFIDALAQKRGESKTVAFTHFSPRDVAGVVQAGVYYLNPDKADNLLLYIPSLRRVRKMTASDTQDPIMGQDLIYDDNEGWLQKLSATRYPYKFELVEEREFLVPAPTVDGAEYISSNNVEFRNVRMERRPLYVVKMTQLDPTYVYGQRIFYVDKETFLFYHIENYDQKGRLYRTWDSNYGWHPDMGIFSWCAFLCLMRDHIDLHSGVQQPYVMPALWERKDLSIEQYINAK